jgi:hypothetical protein
MGNGLDLACSFFSWEGVVLASAVLVAEAHVNQTQKGGAGMSSDSGSVQTLDIPN